MGHNGRVLGEVALCVGFERWEAILPNTCYQQPFLVVKLHHFKYGEIATIKNKKYGTKNKRLERCEV